MAHPHRVRDIAVQAGLSQATVDRVLNGRGGVRASTVAQVGRAVAELDRQQTQLAVDGRTFLVDVVVDAPQRFSHAVRAALEAELPGLRPAVVRGRFTLTEAAPAAEIAAALHRVADRGSHGVVLKAPDSPEVTDAVARVQRAGIPVITLVTDLPGTARLAYVGLDNRAAGATAAYLVDRWLPADDAAVLVIRGDSAFRGEDEREMGFRATLRATARPGAEPRRLVELVHSAGGDDTLRRAVTESLARHGDIAAVYSMYAFGGNAAVLDAFDRAGRRSAVFVTHDLNADNRALLLDGRISAVLHHDLNDDLRRCCWLIMQARGALPGTPVTLTSPIQVVTPYNVPPAR
ncbi:LacI family DNA-binding transcriptional regulator [Nakamurella flavida]|uniref:LacI family DNA-binding transcriptional regulator n=1 Tax=Nakamurella flavida TaxID=363630 RepID=A0A938YLV8_9ACTN|nr:LacI family DNA-binding transcriptional regulator [Nakamurella flavida]MBM9476936.1 LacI family DNA-binding transcriptional regulator [Nakamurella flavida]MDP9779881.1 LacI family transcriptional regulator [Nakamurella flavida]